MAASEGRLCGITQISNELPPLANLAFWGHCPQISRNWWSQSWQTKEMGCCRCSEISEGRNLYVLLSYLEIPCSLTIISLAPSKEKSRIYPVSLFLKLRLEISTSSVQYRLTYSSLLGGLHRMPTRSIGIRAWSILKKRKAWLTVLSEFKSLHATLCYFDCSKKRTFTVLQLTV